MYELKPYKSQIENYFGPLIDKYSLSVNITNHVVKLKGDKSTFEITTGQYFLDLQFVFKNNEEPYNEISIGEILEEKELMNKKLLTDYEISKSEIISNEISKGLFEFSIIIKNYCQDLFDGSYFSKNS